MAVADREQLLQAIARALSPLPEVLAALLFGSRARMRARDDSDVDIAVLLDEAAAPATASARLRRLLDALGGELAADRLDVVVLNQASPALAFQVLKYGIVAFERDPLPLHRFRVRTYSRHADFAHVERLFQRAVRKRALGVVEHG